MIIGIDASRARHPHPTGVEVYSDEIIDGLLALSRSHKKHRLRLYTPKPLAGIPGAVQCVLPFRRLWTQRHLTRELRQNPPDVLFVPSHVLPRWFPARSVITIHDVAFRRFPRAYSLRQLFYLHWTTRHAVRKAWRIIVPSAATRDDLVHYYGCDAKKVVVIPHGFRRPRVAISVARERAILKRFGVADGAVYALFVGRLEHKKNIERLVEAFAQFRSDHPEWRLILGGGRGVGFERLIGRLERRDRLNGVLMPGYLTVEEKDVLMRHARLFTLPSLAEGFGFPILEAAAYGLPILASDIPALREFGSLVDEWVDPLKVDSIANGLTRLAARDASARGKKSLTRFSWNVAARNVWNLLTLSK